MKLLALVLLVPTLAFADPKAEICGLAYNTSFNAQQMRQNHAQHNKRFGYNEYKKQLLELAKTRKEKPVSQVTLNLMLWAAAQTFSMSGSIPANSIADYTQSMCMLMADDEFVAMMEAK